MMALPKARVSVRKMGTRAGQPHYGAECTTCGRVLVVAHATRDAAKAEGEAHKLAGCAHNARYYSNVGR
jgi:hypothetical protein